MAIYKIRVVVFPQNLDTFPDFYTVSIHFFVVYYSFNHIGTLFYRSAEIRKFSKPALRSLCFVFTYLYIRVSVELPQAINPSALQFVQRVCDQSASPFNFQHPVCRHSRIHSNILDVFGPGTG